MLERIDSIDWNKLTHAYGPAGDVPQLLRELTATDQQTRDRALKKIWYTITHQGTVYEATSFAVPFLIELLQEPTVQEKQRILRLVAALGCGTSYHQVHQRYFRKAAEGLEDIIQKELQWVKAAHTEVGKGAPVYLALLQYEDVWVRIHAAYTLACCDEWADEILPSMCRHVLEEKDPRVQCCLLLSLRVVGNPSCRPFLESCLQTLRDPAARFAAAQALAEIMKDETPWEAFEILGNVLANPFELDEVYGQLPWSEGNSVGSRAALALRMAGQRYSQPIAERMLDILNDLKPGDSRNEELVWTALFLTFEQQGKVEAEKLDFRQREVLRRLAVNAEKVNSKRMNFFLARIGLESIDA